MRISEWIPKKDDFRSIWPQPFEIRRGIVRILILGSLLLLFSIILKITLQLSGISVVIPNEIQFMQLLSVLGSLLLSAALVYLYYQQKRILSEEHRSKISASRFLDGENNTIDVLISNSGNGPVHRLFLRVELEFYDGEISGGANHLGLSTEEEDGTSRSFVKPYEAQSSFTKKVLLPLEFRDGTEYNLVPFHQMMNFAENMGTTEGHLTLTIVWEDTLRTGEIQIFDEDFDVEAGLNFEQFIQLYPEHFLNR